jgi:hypothetical protein
VSGSRGCPTIRYPSVLPTIEVDKPAPPMGKPLLHCLVQKTLRALAWDAVLAAKITQSADETASTVTVIIAIACPALATFAEILQQQIEYLYRFPVSGSGIGAPCGGSSDDITGRPIPQRVLIMFDI